MLPQSRVRVRWRPSRRDLKPSHRERQDDEDALFRLEELALHDRRAAQNEALPAMHRPFRKAGRARRIDDKAGIIRRYVVGQPGIGSILDQRRYRRHVCDPARKKRARKRIGGHAQTTPTPALLSSTMEHDKRSVGVPRHAAHQCPMQGVVVGRIRAQDVEWIQHGQLTRGNGTLAR